jgi:hypothetical protein
VITDEIVSAGLRLELVNFEWNNTAEGRHRRVREGPDQRADRAGPGPETKTGRLNGDSRVYGYTFNVDSDTLDLNPQEAEVVKFMYRLLLDGEDGKPLSRRAIAQVLAERGIPTPRGKAWYPATVSKIL